MQNTLSCQFNYIVSSQKYMHVLCIIYVLSCIIYIIYIIYVYVLYAMYYIYIISIFISWLVRFLLFSNRISVYLVLTPFEVHWMNWSPHALTNNTFVNLANHDICCLDIPQPRDICCLDIPRPRDICCLDIPQPRDIWCLDILVNNTYPSVSVYIFKNSLIIYEENTEQISTMSVILCDKILLKISPSWFLRLGQRWFINKNDFMKWVVFEAV